LPWRYKNRNIIDPAAIVDLLFGEVGLIFAGIGLTLMVDGRRVLDEAAFSAILIMVMVTTLVTPPLLQWSFSRVTEKR
jgi:Kef-type K+ transport system membrane component KefB